MNKFPDIFSFVLIFVGLVTIVVGGYATYVGSHVDIQRNCIGEVCTPQSVEFYPYWFIAFPIVGGTLIVLLGITILCIVNSIEGGIQDEQQKI